MNRREPQFVLCTIHIITIRWISVDSRLAGHGFRVPPYDEDGHKVLKIASGNAKVETDVLVEV